MSQTKVIKDLYNRIVEQREHNKGIFIYDDILSNINRNGEVFVEPDGTSGNLNLYGSDNNGRVIRRRFAWISVQSVDKLWSFLKEHGFVKKFRVHSKLDLSEFEGGEGWVSISPRSVEEIGINYGGDRRQK